MGYQWNNTELKKKSGVYNWAAVIFMIIALGFFVALPNYMTSMPASTLNLIILAFVALGFVLFLLGWRIQNQDKKSKKKE